MNSLHESILTSVRAGRASYITKFKEWCETHGIMKYGELLRGNARTLIEGTDYTIDDTNIVLNKNLDCVILDDLPEWLELLNFSKNRVSAIRLNNCTNLKNLPECDHLLLSECEITDFSQLAIKPKFITLEYCKFNNFKGLEKQVLQALNVKFCTFNSLEGLPKKITKEIAIISPDNSCMTPNYYTEHEIRKHIEKCKRVDTICYRPIQDGKIASLKEMVVGSYDILDDVKQFISNVLTKSSSCIAKYPAVLEYLTTKQVGPDCITIQMPITGILKNGKKYELKKGVDPIRLEFVYYFKTQRLTSTNSAVDSLMLACQDESGIKRDKANDCPAYFKDIEVGDFCIDNIVLPIQEYMEKFVDYMIDKVYAQSLTKLNTVV